MKDSDKKSSNCRLPVPRPGQVLGLVGTNGIGKSTALKVLAGKLKPNLGRYNVMPIWLICLYMFLDLFMHLTLFFLSLQNPPDWQEILTYFRGSELQNYFTRILEDNLKVQTFLNLVDCYELWVWTNLSVRFSLAISHVIKYYITIVTG